MYIKTRSKSYNILDINEEELNKIVDYYNFGRESFFLQGKKYWLNHLFEIQMFTFENENIKTGDELMHICKDKRLLESGHMGNNPYIPVKVLEMAGKRVTDIFLKDDYGYLKDTRIEGIISEYFVEPKRIDEISKINNSKFDFTKLTEILKELNVAFAHSLFLAIPLLVRTVIDHVPPLFSKSNFSEVLGGYGSRSFKDSMNNLDKSSRKIADSFLHTQIRNKESLPTKTQVSFKQDLDVLLQEIVRINK